VKLAILADVHSNLPALQAVIEDIHSWHPDQVIVAGDIINRGPCPLECLLLIQEKVQTGGWKILRGNHEEYVLSHEQPDAPKSGPAFEVHQASFWTYQRLTAVMPMLRTLPFTINLIDPSGGEILITHASMKGIRDGIYPWMSDESIRKKFGDPPALLCVGHTHIPLIRLIDGSLVVNVGSAGLPFDGDIRPCYARLTWSKRAWEAKIIRVSYDFQIAERDFFTTGYIENSGPLALLVLLELRYARSQLYQWAEKYQAHVLAGELTMKQSVEEFLRLNSLSTWGYEENLSKLG
jgi:predicted phosphodiesterase